LTYGSLYLIGASAAGHLQKQHPLPVIRPRRRSFSPQTANRFSSVKTDSRSVTDLS
jgi:hypothetical protein